MPWWRAARTIVSVIMTLPLLLAGPSARGDTVVMKSGVVYKTLGTPDKDGALLFLWDGLKRIAVRDSRIERITGDNSYRTGEKFQLVQPLTVHAGVMPKVVVGVEAEPWNEKARRTFRYHVRSPQDRPVTMEQAIIEISPHIVKYRGIDGFWLGQVETGQIPREIMLAVLARVDQKNQGERERVVRFLMDAGWYAEAREELERMVRDFPGGELTERAAGARTFLIQAEASRRRAEIEVRRRAQQPAEVSRLLKTFNDKEIGTEQLIEVRELMRREDEQRANDLAVLTDLNKLEGRLSKAARTAWTKRVAEVRKTLKEAPDAIRDRLGAWRKAKGAPGTTDEAQLALAMSGYLIGPEGASPDLKVADTLWQARDLIRDYLKALEPTAREDLVAKLDNLEWPAEEGTPEDLRKLDLATRLIQYMSPPLHDAEAKPGKPIEHKVLEDGNAVPTSYAVQLPPEYHPSRSYPALIVLHSGHGPAPALEQWGAEAARRGFVLIAPEYSLPGSKAGDSAEYQYSPSEHAAVELALRDARKRHAIDSDRVFLAGQLTGGNMAWDLGLAHPDLFAGIMVGSGFPAHYVPRYIEQHKYVPMFFVTGDLAPASNEIIFNNYLKRIILKGWDVTYTEYHHRGLEEFPEEIPTFLEWTARHRRDPVVKQFDVSSARACDDRFWGVVIREFSEGRANTPLSSDDMLGQNLRPATLRMRSSNLSNLVSLQAAGVKQVDVWLSPRLIDFKRKLEVRINGKARFKGQAQLEFRDLLEDLRIRGDRQQVYWMKVSAG